MYILVHDIHVNKKELFGTFKKVDYKVQVHVPCVSPRYLNFGLVGMQLISLAEFCSSVPCCIIRFGQLHGTGALLAACHLSSYWLAWLVFQLSCSAVIYGHLSHVIIIRLALTLFC